MDRRNHVPYFLTLIFGLAAAALRLWSLNTALDDEGLPVMHLSVVVFFGVGILFALLALFFSIRSARLENTYSVLEYGRFGVLCGLAAAILLGLGAAAEFAGALRDGPAIYDPILLLLGLLGCICLIVAVLSRRQKGTPQKAAEILPVVYLLAKLLLNFREWSTDPIILDYWVELLALMLLLLAVFHGAGFVLDQGKPRRTLFFSMTAVYFCAAAMMDGVSRLSLSVICTCAGGLLWQLPVIWDMYREKTQES